MKIFIVLIMLFFITGCGGKVTEKYEENGEMELYGSSIIDIYNDSGNIYISESEDGIIHYSSEIEVESDSFEIIKEAKEEELFLQVVVGSVAVLKIANPLKKKNIKVKSTLNISVPKNIDLKIKTKNGKILLNNYVGNNINVSNKNGNIKIGNVKATTINSYVSGGNLNVIDSEASYILKTVNGNLYLKPILNYKNSSKITVFNGNLELETSPNDSVRFKAKVRNGKIISDFEKVKNNLYIINGGNSEFKIELINGNFSLIDSLKN